MFFLKKIFFIIYFIVIVIFQVFSQIKITNNEKQLYKEALSLYTNGNFGLSENILLSIIKNKKYIDTINLIAINNQLGIISKKMGVYKKSIFYYNNNLELLEKSSIYYFSELSETFNNIANVYRLQGKINKSIEYFKRAIKVIDKTKIISQKKDSLIFKKYHNLGLAYFKIRNFRKAVYYYNKSISIRNQYGLLGIDKVYFNLARTYFELNDFEKTDFYYRKAIQIREKENGINYYRLAPLYMNYGDFLRTQEQYKEAKIYLEKAIKLYEDNYKKRHPFTANSYVYLGKYYLSVKKPDSALYWFQKSLIANSKHFNESDITKNPDINDCFSGLQMLGSVKMKSKAIISLAKNKDFNKQKELLELSLKTSDIAINVISNIRKGYIYSDSKLIITEEEKECYTLSVKATINLYKLTNDIKYLELAYSYASESKASVMNENLAEEREMYKLIPDSIMQIKKEQEQKILAYKKLLFEENEKLKPNKNKISLWEDKLFDLNNTYDNFIERLKKDYNISESSTKETLSVKEIQSNLHDETTVVEYFISKDKDTKETNLYFFIISKTGFRHIKRKLSKDFYENLFFFKNRFAKNDTLEIDLNSFNKFNKISYELYKELFKPIQNILKTKNIILIPDEEISFVSFDALMNGYKENTKINYSDLNYLIYDYCFSYAYSINLLFRKDSAEYSDFVYAFAPDYIEKKASTTRQNFGKLNNTQKEINAILNYFNGKSYSRSFASVDSFEIVSKKGAVLHLALHSFSNEEEKDFSCLAFSNIENDNNLLYAYEIEKMKINSPMVVLSSCNSGNGKLYSGEGVMSLSRSFINAGVSSVIHSLWDVNDDAGYKIMNYFYKSLSEGKAKNIALREAKLKYLQEVSPSFANPKYWASYVLTGNISPIKKTNNFLYLLFFAGIILIGSFIFLRKKVINR